MRSAVACLLMHFRCFGGRHPTHFCIFVLDNCTWLHIQVEKMPSLSVTVKKSFTIYELWLMKLYLLSITTAHLHFFQPFLCFNHSNILKISASQIKVGSLQIDFLGSFLDAYSDHRATNRKFAWVGSWWPATSVKLILGRIFYTSKQFALKVWTVVYYVNQSADDSY